LPLWSFLLARLSKQTPFIWKDSTLCRQSYVSSGHSIRFPPDTKQLIVEYYLHWTTTFEISFSGSSDTNHDSLLSNTAYTAEIWDIFSDHLSDTIDQLCVISIMKTHVKLKMFVPYKWLCFKPKYLIAHNKDFSLVLFVLKDLFFLQRTHSMLSNLNFFL
jgi:hypothetical protein